ncbi:hypothetical protein IQ22_00669 [Pseudomonas duriflava]|uniref:Uncharacterized protein n=1 Tax=Pseudomonas duriflava TaxID=459528 RepID=A0A562QLA3_9PSED|nr:hypothetical protein [Pseudomonas duriflava]TWI57453.1 hypothetical protein IQ22_00669 [Pseudomonas duriflava]
MTSTSHPTFQALEEAQRIAARWQEPDCKCTAEEPKEAFDALFAQWAPSGADVGFLKQADEALLAVKHVLNDWAQRGGDSAEVQTQLLWILEQEALLAAQRNYIAGLNGA